MCVCKSSRWYEVVLEEPADLFGYEKTQRTDRNIGHVGTAAVTSERCMFVCGRELHMPVNAYVA